MPEPLAPHFEATLPLSEACLPALATAGAFVTDVDTCFCSPHDFAGYEVVWETSVLDCCTGTGALVAQGPLACLGRACPTACSLTLHTVHFWVIFCLVDTADWLLPWLLAAVLQVWHVIRHLALNTTLLLWLQHVDGVCWRAFVHAGLQVGEATNGVHQIRSMCHC